MTVAPSGGGRRFWKLSGSGNDFVFLDARGQDRRDPLESPQTISSICAQHLGVGADGVVFLYDTPDAAFGIRYYNADGSHGALCGNASLCTAQLAVTLGLADPEVTFDFISDAGRVTARGSEAGPATVRLAPVTALELDAPETRLDGERRIGFAMVGVPHLVILVDDLAAKDVQTRGRELRFGALRAPAGANVNFVSTSAPDGIWRIRTYERGVEAETLACGTGTVASAACLRAWRGTPPAASVSLQTASGRLLSVRLPDSASAGAWSELTGEGRLVFEGVLRSIS